MGEGGEVAAGDEVDVALEALADDAALKVDGEEAVVVARDDVDVDVGPLLEAAG